MSENKAMKRRLSDRSVWVPRIVLFLSLVITAIAGYYTKYKIEANEKKEFGYACNELKKAISIRLSAHAQLLRSGSAFMMSTDKVTRKEWKRFVENERIENNLPGVQGIGYSLIIPKEKKLQHIEEIRREGFPDYTIRPEGERDTYTSIIYLEPFTGRNLRAFGYDMFSEKTRRAAMEKARDSNVAMLSGKVMLVQETEKDLQAGTLMYVPVYKHNMPLNTVEERRRAIKGWVYSPYRMNDLMMGILGRWEMQEDIGNHIHIYDGDSLSAETLLYESKSGDTTKLKETLRLTMPLDFNGKHWTLDFIKNDDRSQIFTPVIFLLAGGILISILIYFLIISYVNTRRRAEVLSESEKQYKYLSDQFEAILDHIPGLVFYKDRNNNLISVNKYYADGHGKEKLELQGKNLADIYPKEDAAQYYEDDLSVINSGQARLN
ncbi:MAG: CHASE domain-containing protein, partial [Ignavibacteriota bacterium]